VIQKRRAPAGVPALTSRKIFLIFSTEDSRDSRVPSQGEG
jgi:hypothetical protein